MTIYDTIIIGGGIAGLYAAYEILKKDPQKSILILEKAPILGGRIDTYHDKYMTVEAGAGRFHEGHALLLNLLKELHLTTKIKKISSGASYAPIETPGVFKDSIQDAPISKSTDITVQLTNNIANLATRVIVGEKTIPNAALLLKVIVASKLETKETLINTSFIEYAKKVLDTKQIEYIKNTFGYYTELVLMNAYDAIYLMEKQLTPANQFYVLDGGLSQIIEQLEKQIKKYKNAKILCKKTVSDIYYNDEKLFEITATTKYYSKNCICAVTKEVLEKLKIFRPIYPMLKKIKSSPLCRIYCKFAEPWFASLPKLTTNNNLRMIIPYDTNRKTIMISYTDNKYAEFWKRLYDEKGEESLNIELKKQIKQSTNLDMQNPIKTKQFYWSHGVGYWGIGADSEKIAKNIEKPFNNMELYICGENYSEKNQQWIEGALDTAKNVISQITR